MRIRILWVLLGLTILFTITWYLYSELVMDYYSFIEIKLKSSVEFVTKTSSDLWVAFARLVSEVWLPAARSWLFNSVPAIWVSVRTFLSIQIERLFLVDIWKKLLMAPVMGIAIHRIGPPRRRKYKEIIDKLKDWMMRKKQIFSGLPRWLQFVSVIFIMITIIAISFVIWWFGFLLFFISFPKWISLGITSFFVSIWMTIQRAVFQGVFFEFFTKKIHLFVITRLFSDEFEQKLQCLLFRSARAVIRRRNMTVTDIREEGLTLSLYWDLEKERWSRILQVFREHLSGSKNANPQA